MCIEWSYSYSIASGSRLNILVQAGIEFLTPNRHFHRVERILHNKVGVKLVHALGYDVNVRLGGLGEQQKLRACLRLEASEAKLGRLHDLEAAGSRRKALRRARRLQRRWQQASGNGVHSVKGAGQDEQVVAGELG